MKLYELAKVVRSKNAGPYQITLDVIFDNEQDFRTFTESGVVDVAWVAEKYRVPEDEVRIIPYPPAHAVKITIPRRTACGSPDDMDVYGAQQHGPLLDLELPERSGATAS